MSGLSGVASGQASRPLSRAGSAGRYDRGLRIAMGALRSGNMMIEAIFGEGAFVAVGAFWHQLAQLWELIVMVCRFLWDLLKLLSGAG
ncbi:hypothetical protein FHX57_001792 [Paraburkholderia tropica]|uniref:hypothetical protein n=1 Tax=Paraburkholderia tropica TaxID=92647 RepID=UPI001610AC0F|nr:hypothetical protein [Paraburkholderia tropica]MBB2999461.1 hypothetical protein [Paraburkholderia tropica]MBB6317917.1 hypothetical protein [Paraburkholderia tropica]